ncbi:hypothetical protein M569_06325, partial [Genlisea aurea]
PTTYFEVTRPIPVPNTKPCSYSVLQHDFGYTYGQPPVLADYTPPTNCASLNSETIVLEWRATCKGRQFDRIFGVWLGGVEILRSCTAEPRATGIEWSVRKDITRYKSLLKHNQTLAVYLGNIVDSTYTGVYHVDVTLHFYPAEDDHQNELLDDDVVSVADLILPISRSPPLNDGFWFEIKNSTDPQSKKRFEIPRNAYRAVLEVYVSYHENDEFWYTNFPNEYIAANNLTGSPGNGPFREVVVSLDGSVVGAVWPFTVIYTGGINPLLWRPITGIGSFDLPSYDVELTPLLSRMLDGKSHELGFSVTGGLNVWYVDANLHLWMDHDVEKTRGKLLEYGSPPLSYSLHSDFSGLDGSFTTNVSRTVHHRGWVESSKGKTVTEFRQSLHYSNSMIMGNDGNSQVVNQTINFGTDLDIKTASSSSKSSSPKEFTLYLYTSDVNNADGTVDSIANVSLGLEEKSRKNASVSGVSSSWLKNLQRGQGSIVVNGSSVVSGTGATQQVELYEGSKSCYFRNVSSSNYSIVYDDE